MLGIQKQRSLKRGPASKARLAQNDDNEKKAKRKKKNKKRKKNNENKNEMKNEK